MKKNILFVCKYNRFRSKVAESLFNKINKNGKYNAKSAGLIKGLPINQKQKEISRRFNIIIKNPTQGLSTKLLKWQNVIIIVADDVPSIIFKDNKNYYKELIVWKIKDAKTDDEKEVIKIVKKIESKVYKYLDKLK